MTNLTDFPKTVETGMDPPLLNCLRLTSQCYAPCVACLNYDLACDMVYEFATKDILSFICFKYLTTE